MNSNNAMKPMIIVVIGLLSLCSFSQIDSPSQLHTTNKVENDYDSLIIYYSYAALGSQFGSMQPTFSVKGKNYTYELRQNSFYTNQKRKEPQKICDGILRTSSIDSIIAITKDIKDTLIYKTNINIMSGGIHEITVQHDQIKVTFRLHNASDPRARKIIDILNANIPADKTKLWLFDFPETK